MNKLALIIKTSCFLLYSFSPQYSWAEAPITAECNSLFVHDTLYLDTGMKTLGMMLAADPNTNFVTYEDTFYVQSNSLGIKTNLRFETGPITPQTKEALVEFFSIIKKEKRGFSLEQLQALIKKHKAVVYVHQVSTENHKMSLVEVSKFISQTLKISLNRSSDIFLSLP